MEESLIFVKEKIIYRLLLNIDSLGFKPFKFEELFFLNEDDTNDNLFIRNFY